MTAPTTAPNDHLVVIERQNSSDVLLVYPDAATAARALEESMLVDDLCAEDSLDTYVPDDDVVIDTDDYEVTVIQAHEIPAEFGEI